MSEPLPDIMAPADRRCFADARMVALEPPVIAGRLRSRCPKPDTTIVRNEPTADAAGEDKIFDREKTESLIARDRN